MESPIIDIEKQKNRRQSKNNYVCVLQKENPMSLRKS